MPYQQQSLTEFESTSTDDFTEQMFSIGILLFPFTISKASNVIFIACGSVEFEDSSYTCIQFFFFFNLTNEKKIIQNCTVVLIIKLVNQL